MCKSIIVRGEPEAALAFTARQSIRATADRAGMGAGVAVGLYPRSYPPSPGDSPDKNSLSEATETMKLRLFAPLPNETPRSRPLRIKHLMLVPEIPSNSLVSLTDSARRQDRSIGLLGLVKFPPFSGQVVKLDF